MLGLPYGSKHLKDTGILQAYQAFISNLMQNGPPDGDPLENASKFVLNYESNVRSQRPKITDLENTVENAENLEPKNLKKERSKIILKTKSRVHPSSQNINPSVFETQDRKRPIISAYKQQEIDYSYIDVFDGKRIQLDPLNREPSVDWGSTGEYEISDMNHEEKEADISIVNYDVHDKKPGSSSSVRSMGSRKDLDSRQSQMSNESDKRAKTLREVKAPKDEAIEKPGSAKSYEERKPQSGKSSKKETE